MPLDPNIILGVKPAQIQQQDPLEQYTKSMALRNLMNQGDVQDYALKSAKRTDERKTALDALLATDPSEQALLKGGFLDESLKLGKDARERAKLEAETVEKKAQAAKHVNDVAITRLQHGAAVLGTAKDQGSYEQALSIMARSFGPEAVAGMPPQFDPQFVQASIARGMTRVQQLADQRTAEQQAETARNHRATETNAAGQLAVSQGSLAETRRHNKFGEENPAMQHVDTGDGLVAFNPRGGTAKPVIGPDGKPLQGGKALTESQGKATGMALRAQAAHDILTGLEDSGTKTPGLLKMGAEKIPLVGGAAAMGVNALPSWAGGPNSDQQKVEQAQRDFVNAALRVESGAAISQSEFDNARRQYFPQPGDSPEVIEQKRKNRETEIHSLKIQAGPGSKHVVSKPKEAKAPKVDPSKLSDAEIRRELGIPGG